MSSGDTLIASPNLDGTFTLENDGVVGTGAAQRTSNSTNTNQAPGGRDFYIDEALFGGSTAHQEATLGYLAGMRGTREIVTTAYDPLSDFNTTGFAWKDVDTGQQVTGYELTPVGAIDGSDGNFQKGGGLGGISLLAEAAPVEIGNRVWFDADSDGIQDPSEPSLAGVTVELIRNGVVVGTTTTDANGEYYFSSDPDSEFYDADLEPDGGDYTVRFVKPTTGNVFVDHPVYGTLGWDRADFTIAEATTSEIGSNPDPTTGEFTFTVGGPGENNHEIDAGFFPDVEPAVDIEKGDGSGTTIDSRCRHDAGRGELYPG